MRLTSAYTRVAAPWGKICLWDPDNPHKLADCVVELLTEGGRKVVAKGQAGFPCYICGNPLTFLNGYLKEPSPYHGDNIVYWQRTIWDSWTDARRNYVKGHVPNVEDMLK